MNTTYRTDHELAAYQLGVQAALSAASWVTDGNTDAAHYQRVIGMIDAGDPGMEEYLPAEPNLSGEWADNPTPTSLYGDIIGYNEDGGIDDPDGELTASLCSAWEEGVADTFMAECERLIRAAVS